jgi:hypothetical protein
MVKADAIRRIRSNRGAVERTVRKPHTGSRSGWEHQPERLGAGPPQRTRARPTRGDVPGTLQRLHRAEHKAPSGKAPEVETGGRRLRKPERGTKAQGSNGPCIASALRAKAIAGPVDRRERLVRGAKTQEPNVRLRQRRDGLSRHPRAKPLAAAKTRDPTAGGFERLETNAHPRTTGARLRRAIVNPTSVGGRQTRSAQVVRTADEPGTSPRKETGDE